MQVAPASAGRRFGPCRCRKQGEGCSEAATVQSLGGPRACQPDSQPLNRLLPRPPTQSTSLILTPFEWMIAKRYMLPGRGEAFIALVAGISLAAVMLGVAALVIVMSVMNGFRAELFDKIVGLNGHAIIQAYGGRLENWQQVLKEVRATPGVVRASPLIEQPLLATFNGRVEAILARGNTPEDIGRLKPQLKQGNLAELQANAGNVAIVARLAAHLVRQVVRT